jgi:hypothetical protein
MAMAYSTEAAYIFLIRAVMSRVQVGKVKLYTN